MRKIERQMNNAISNNIDWKCANTEVIFDADTNESTVYLHGNKIAEVGDDYIRLFDGGWQSNTTKSRLNALLSEFTYNGLSLVQRNWTWFLRDNDFTNKALVPFVSGMTV